MFDRWRQENFFKYMREEFLLDALIDYQIEAQLALEQAHGLVVQKDNPPGARRDRRDAG